MSGRKTMELPPMVGMDPAYSPRTGRLRTPAEIAALAPGPPPTTLGFSGKPGSVANISGRAQHHVDPAYLRMLQQPGPIEFGASSLASSGLMSATLARARQTYDKEFDRTRVLLDKMEQEQSEQHRERGRAQSQHREQGRAQSPQHGPAQQRARPRSHSPEKYPAPKNKEDAFAILGIPSSSTIQEIRKAYLRLAKLLHPDKNINNLEEANVRFQQLGAALDIINDPQQNGGRNRSYILYRKLKTCHRRRNSRHAKRLHKSSKSSKSSKRYSKKYHK